MQQWPPDYTFLFKERIERFQGMEANPSLILGAKEYYKNKPVEFINDFCITYDPRNVAKDLPTLMPFQLFPRQKDLVLFFADCLFSSEQGLVEKCRDMGATWIAVVFSVWLFLFHEGSAVGWGSRKEALVDKIGDPDSIFEKIRMVLRYLPVWMQPKGFDIQKHTSYMKIINPENGATITGEAGDNIGRGGRKLIYFKDESAHYERPDKIEAALGDNTDVQIDISSVHGTGNVFHRRRMAGVVYDSKSGIKEKRAGRSQVFIMDWRDHPAKNQEWYDNRRAKAEREGLIHVFNQEVDRDYTSAVEGILIPGAWVKSAIDAHIKLGFQAEGKHRAGFDPYDEGMDAHALVSSKGSVFTYAEMWQEGDTGQATRKVVSLCKQRGISHMQFDGIGIGAGVKTEANRLREAKKLAKSFKVVKWLSSNAVQFPNEYIFDPESDCHRDELPPKNRDFYANLKAQAGWQLRLRFERTHKAVTQGEKYQVEELISIPSDLPERVAFENELSQPTFKYSPASGKIMINKTPEGTKSPNLFDGALMSTFEIQVFDISGSIVMGAPGGDKVKGMAA